MTAHWNKVGWPAGYVVVTAVAVVVCFFWVVVGGGDEIAEASV
jgi:hypothetical protein